MLRRTMPIACHVPTAATTTVLFALITAAVSTAMILAVIVALVVVLLPVAISHVVPCPFTISIPIAVIFGGTIALNPVHVTHVTTVVSSAVILLFALLVLDGRFWCRRAGP